MYKLFYVTMLIGYLGITLMIPDLKGKCVGFLLLLVNAIVLWR